MAASLENIILILVTILCAYGALKMHQLHKRTKDLRYIVFLSILLLAFTDTWISFYGGNVSAVFSQYRFLFTFIPLAVYGLYAWMDHRRMAEEEEKQKIKQAFQQYLMPAIVEEMLKDPSKLKLGGEKKNLAIMFSDVRGFTTLSEKLTPEELVSFLNEYLNDMTNVILENRGTVDKYIGDAIMAFWGAPLSDPEHIVLSVKTAVEMMDKLNSKKAEWKARGLPDIDIGIGINCGDVVVGNMGCEKRFDYTCLGDHVNLASRLEGLNKMYGTHIIVSEFVESRIKGLFVVRELDLVTVKGKKQPVKIFEVLGTSADGKTKMFLADYDHALSLYRQQHWSRAKSAFLKSLEARDDLTAKNYVDRCAMYERNPPPADWNGVTEIKTK